MDIMHVLQDICKNPEAHDKGTDATRLLRPQHVTQLLPHMASTFLPRVPVQVHRAHLAGRGPSFRPLQQHRRAAALQAVPAAGGHRAAVGRRQRRAGPPLLQRLPLHPVELVAHGVSGGRHEAERLQPTGGGHSSKDNQPVFTFIYAFTLTLSCVLRPAQRESV